MKKLLPAMLAVLILSSCSSVMMTGRRQLNLVSDAELNQMSFAAYAQLKDSVPMSTDKTSTAMVKRVGTNIAAAVEKYMRENGLEEQIANFQWEYNLFKINHYITAANAKLDTHAKKTICCFHFIIYQSY